MRTVLKHIRIDVGISLECSEFSELFFFRRATKYMGRRRCVTAGKTHSRDPLAGASS